MTPIHSPWSSDIAHTIIASLPEVLTDDILAYAQITQTLLIPLQNRSLLRVEGKDSASFLQGQCTCDFGRLDQYRQTLGAHCNIKGRMHASFTAAALPSDDSRAIGLRVNASLSDYALSQLKKYAVFSKVTLTHEPQYLCAALFLPEISALNNHIGQQVSLPEIGSYQFYPADGGPIVALRQQPRLLEVWALPAALEQWIKSFKLDLARAPEALWDVLHIRAGIGEVTGPTQDMLLPQELNFQLLDGVSFNKGCYTGQEIIARLHYRGQLKKHLYPVALAGPSLPEQGESLTDHTGKVIAHVINIVVTGEGCAHALILTASSHYRATALAYHKNNALKLSWHNLPYAIH